MKFSYSWLCDHLDTKLSPLEIAETLTNIGLELESLSDYSSYAQFVVAKICLLYTSPSPRDGLLSRMPSSA